MLGTPRTNATKTGPLDRWARGALLGSTWDGTIHRHTQDYARGPQLELVLSLSRGHSKDYIRANHLDRGPKGQDLHESKRGRGRENARDPVS